MTRRRYRWDDDLGAMVEIPLDWTPPQRVPVYNDAHYHGLQATDGTDISSKRKHREYMQRKGLTTIDDFKETWAKAARERENFFKGDFDKKERRETIGRVIYELENKRKK